MEGPRVTGGPDRSLFAGWRPLACSAVLWAASLPTLKALEASRPGEAGGGLRVERGVGEVLSTSLLGGFRAIAVDFLMVRAQGQMEEGRFYELSGIYETVTRMVPNSEAGWIYLSWNLAFNIPPEIEEPAVHWRYLREGLLLCRRGQERVPNSWRLASWEAYIILRKCAPSTDLAGRLEADRDLNPGGASPARLAFDRAVFSISIEGHTPLADLIALQALGRLLPADGTPGPGFRSEAERLLEHLRREGGRREPMRAELEAYIERVFGER